MRWDGLLSCCAVSPHGSKANPLEVQRSAQPPTQPPKKSWDDEADGRLRVLCDQLLSQCGRQAAESSLVELGESEASPVFRESFRQHLRQRLHFDGDADLLFDLLDPLCSGTVTVGELRAQLRKSFGGQRHGPFDAGSAELKPVGDTGGCFAPDRLEQRMPSQLTQTSTRSSLHEAACSPPRRFENADAAEKGTERPLSAKSTEASSEDQQPLLGGGGGGADRKSKSGKKKNASMSPAPPQVKQISASEGSRGSGKPSGVPDVLEPPRTSGCINAPMLVVAPVAKGEDAQGNPLMDRSQGVRFRPLPYEPVPWDAEDNGRQRAFVWKGELIKIPMLPIQTLNNKSKAQAAAKAGNATHGKGWALVKSKAHALKDVDKR